MRRMSSISMMPCRLTRSSGQGTDTTRQELASAVNSRPAAVRKAAQPKRAGSSVSADENVAGQIPPTPSAMQAMAPGRISLLVRAIADEASPSGPRGQARPPQLNRGWLVALTTTTTSSTGTGCSCWPSSSKAAIQCDTSGAPANWKQRFRNAHDRWRYWPVVSASVVPLHSGPVSSR